MGSFLVCRLVLPDTGVIIQQDAKDESFNTFDNNRVAKVDLFATYAIQGAGPRSGLWEAITTHAIPNATIISFMAGLL